MNEFIRFCFVDVFGGFVELLIPPMTTQDFKYLVILGLVFTGAVVIKKIIN